MWRIPSSQDKLQKIIHQFSVLTKCDGSHSNPVTEFICKLSQSQETLASSSRLSLLPNVNGLVTERPLSQALFADQNVDLVRLAPIHGKSAPATLAPVTLAHTKPKLVRSQPNRSTTAKLVSVKSAPLTSTESSHSKALSPNLHITSTSDADEPVKSYFAFTQPTRAPRSHITSAPVNSLHPMRHPRHRNHTSPSAACAGGNIKWDFGRLKEIEYYMRKHACMDTDTLSLHVRLASLMQHVSHTDRRYHKVLKLQCQLWQKYMQCLNTKVATKVSAINVINRNSNGKNPEKKIEQKARDRETDAKSQKTHVNAQNTETTIRDGHKNTESNVAKTKNIQSDHKDTKIETETHTKLTTESPASKFVTTPSYKSSTMQSAGRHIFIKDNDYVSIKGKRLRVDSGVFDSPILFY